MLSHVTERKRVYGAPHPLSERRSSELEWEVGVRVSWRSGLWGLTDTQGSVQHRPKSWGTKWICPDVEEQKQGGQKRWCGEWEAESEGEELYGCSSGEPEP